MPPNGKRCRPGSLSVAGVVVQAMPPLDSSWTFPRSHAASAGRFMSPKPHPPMVVALGALNVESVSLAVLSSTLSIWPDNSFRYGQSATIVQGFVCLYLKTSPPHFRSSRGAMKAVKGEASSARHFSFISSIVQRFPLVSEMAVERSRTPVPFTAPSDPLTSAAPFSVLSFCPRASVPRSAFSSWTFRTQPPDATALEMTPAPDSPSGT